MCRNRGQRLKFVVLIVLALMSNLQLTVPEATAQTLVLSIPVGVGPEGVAVDTNANRIYVANPSSWTISIIDGNTNTIPQTLSFLAFYMGVNPNTHRIYLIGGSNLVFVIDSNTNAVLTTVAVETFPSNLGVNPNTNRIYVTTGDCAPPCVGNNVSVIDGATNTLIKTIKVGRFPTAVGINFNTNRIYIPNGDNNSVSVIDGQINSVVATVPVGGQPFGVGVNSNTNRIYVSNFVSNTVSIIDGNLNSVVATTTVGKHPSHIGVNPITNHIYVANSESDTVSVLDGNTNTVMTTIPVDAYPLGVAVNPVTNRVYVTNSVSRTVSVILDYPAFVVSDQAWMPLINGGVASNSRALMDNTAKSQTAAQTESIDYTALLFGAIVLSCGVYTRKRWFARRTSDSERL